jgi:hypothetical protein
MSMACIGSWSSEQGDMAPDGIRPNRRQRLNHR